MIELSYDGHGINDLRSEYAPRIATFVSADDGERFGKLFAAAPDMLASLKNIYAHLVNGDNARAVMTELARAAIAKAEGTS